MKKLFQTNTFIFGALLALITPVFFYLFLGVLIDYLSGIFTHGIPLIKDHSLMLISIFLNMVIFYTYIHKEPYDKTGKGVLVITFTLTLIYFGWRFIVMM
jgi:hypothetical protein